METIKEKFGEMKELANDMLKTSTKGEKGHGPEDDLKKEPVSTEWRNDGMHTMSPADSRLPDKMRALVYKGTEKVAVETVDLLKFKSPRDEPLPHSIVVKVITSAICGSDLHMYRGRADFPHGLSFGHEVTGEVVEKGIDVRFVNIGDWVSIPFNVSCGRCRNCIDGKMQACLHVNPMAAQGAYGYSMAGGWPGGQAEFMLVPFADYNCLRFPDKAKAREHILDLAYLTDILPTGYHGCIQAGVSGGKMVFIAGAGPVGLCAAASAYLLGASLVVIADKFEERLEAAKQMGCLTINIADVNETTFNSKLKELTGYDFLDCAVECVGFEASGLGSGRDKNQPCGALDLCILATKAGGQIGCPGVFLPADKGGPDAESKMGHLRFKFGEMWTRGITLGTGQCPVNNYNYYLMQAILNGRLSVHKYLNTQVISLDSAPEAYKLFNQGKWVKYLIDPHNTLGMR